MCSDAEYGRNATSRYQPEIKVGGTVGGLIFAIGSMAIFLVGVQGLWLFLVGAIALGAAFASIFYLVRRAAAKSESRNTIHVV